MAVLPTHNAKNGKAAAGARFRQRKISLKVALPLYNQKDVPSAELELEPSQLHHLKSGAAQPRDANGIETGVDKNEEDEVHLQQVINAAQRALMGGAQKDKKDDGKATSVYIPTPDASRIWPDAKKYYNDAAFVEPESYIKFSATVEDTLGVEYNMDEEDEEFLKNVLPKEVVKTRPKNEKELVQCTELEFETICDKFEKTIEEKQPFLAVDPSTILSYKALSAHILNEYNSAANKDYPYSVDGRKLTYLPTSTLKEKLAKELNFEPFVTFFDKDHLSTSQTRSIPHLLSLFGEPIYNHWKQRKIERKGRTISPLLKFEDPNANEKENDNDPYVCFRRREFRQARKTRRADNLGAERIRSLQKMLKRSRDIVFQSCKRELMKLDLMRAEYELFKTRAQAKAVKRLASIKGDDHLFYPHKRRNIIKIEPEDEEEPEITRTRRKPESTSQAQVKEKAYNVSEQPEASSTQPYVKLPASKIPDMDLVTVSLVLKEKNETIKRAVIEKLKKRKEYDRGYVNIAYDPHQPFFHISTNERGKNMELSHIPYSSIASNTFHQVNTSNIIDDLLKKYLEDGKKPLPGVKTFRGANGSLVASKPFSQLHTLLDEHLSSKAASNGYVARLLKSIETNDFSTYSTGFAGTNDDDTVGESSAPIFRLRKRVARANRMFIDRRSSLSRPDSAIESWLQEKEVVDEPEEADASKDDSMQLTTTRNAYDCKADVVKRMDSRWRFDNDSTEYDEGMLNPFGLDPSRLNCISDDTQSIRFGTMLLSKSYDLLRESSHQRLVLLQQARMRVMQQLNRNLQGLQGSGLANSGLARAQLGASGSQVRKDLPQSKGMMVPKSTTSTTGSAASRLQQLTPQQLQTMQHYRKQQQAQALAQQQQVQQGQGFANGSNGFLNAKPRP